MTKILSKLFAALLCVVVTSMNANASSAFISSMTLLSTKSSMTSHKKLVETHLHKEQELQCMALALYHEARGEPVIGQYAVGATILNRVKSSAYPSTICGVVFQNEHKKFRCQFSFACDGISDLPRNKKSYLKVTRLAKTLLLKGISREAKFMGQNFHSTVNDMTHYHRYDVNPVWSKKLKTISSLGAHIFFKSKRVTKRYTY